MDDDSLSETDVQVKLTVIFKKAGSADGADSAFLTF